jgi:lauroyl/myristoyl acyltransferase/FMN phosphatase YigB (HAD superfamily)
MIDDMKGLSISRFIQRNGNILFFRYAPNRIGFYYVKLVFHLYYFFRFREKRIIRRNIRDFLRGLQWRDDRLMRRVMRGAFNGIFMHYYEKMFSAYKPYREVVRYFSSAVTVEGQEHLDEALKNGAGVILVTAHWGGVEYIPWALAMRQYPLSVILEYQSEKLRQYLRNKNRHFKAVQLLNHSEVDSIWKHALQSLQQNRIVMTQCDEVDVWRRREKRVMPLFNRSVYYDNTIEIMAKHTGAAVISAYMERRSPRRYHLRLEKTVATDPREIGLWVYRRFGYFISTYPEQWYQWKKWNKVLAKNPADNRTSGQHAYRAVVFDLDNTLYHGYKLRRKVLSRVALHNPRGMRRVVALPAARNSISGTRFDSGKELVQEIARRIASTGEQAATEEIARWYCGPFYEHFLAVLHRGFNAPTHVLKMLQILRKGGVKLFCYSDYSRVAERLNAVGLPPDLFDGIYSSEDSGSLKPSPTVLQEIARVAATEPADILMVGDRDDTDGQSAKLAGCDFFRIQGETSMQFQESWRVLAHRLDIPEGEQAR